MEENGSGTGRLYPAGRFPPVILTVIAMRGGEIPPLVSPAGPGKGGSMADEAVISYALYTNSATDSPDDFYARPVGVQTLGGEDLIEDAALRGGKLGADVLRTALGELAAAAARLTGRGFALSTPLFSTTFSLQGKITAGALAGEPEEEDEARNPRKVRVNMHPGEAVRAAGAALRTKRVQPPESGPSVDVIVNDTDGAVNSTIIPGGPVTVTGHHLAVRGEDASVGVYFRPVSGGGMVKVTTRLIENKPARLVFLAPAGLTAGQEVHLVLITQYTTGRRELNAPRTYECPITLTVSAA